MNRALVLVVALLIVLAGSIGSVLAKDHKDDKDASSDTKVTAEMCKKNGWKDLKDEDGQPFKNQGQCVSYAKQGGTLQPIEPDQAALARISTPDVRVTPAVVATAGPTEGPDERLTLVDGQEPWNGYLEGTGFTPGAKLIAVTFASDRETLTLNTPVGTVIEEDGTFTTGRIIYWCSEFDGYGETRGTVTVEDSSGETYSQTFDMSMHCSPSE